MPKVTPEAKTKTQGCLKNIGDVLMAPVSGDFEKSPVVLHLKRPARGLARRVARKISLMGNRTEEKHPDSLNTLTSTVKSSSGLKPVLKKSHEEPKLNQAEMICEVDIRVVPQYSPSWGIWGNIDFRIPHSPFALPMGKIGENGEDFLRFLHQKPILFY